MLSLHEYYQSSPVLQRIHEFLSGPESQIPTCAFLATSRDAKRPEFIRKSVQDLDYFLFVEKDFSRSLWDQTGLIIDLDMEYVNLDFPAEPYLNRRRSFHLQEPVVSAVKSQLAEFGINPLHTMSGRGHHFLWRISRSSQAFQQLAGLDALTSEMENKYLSQPPVFGHSLDVPLGKAYAGAGIIMEFLTQSVQAQVNQTSSIPVQIMETAVPPQQRGRELISLDISEYADPLHTRVVRVPFSVYLKHLWKTDTANSALQQQIPLILVLPVCRNNIQAMIPLTQDFNQGVETAIKNSARIPDYSIQTEELIRAYQKSRLRSFHLDFYRHSHDPDTVWPSTYDRTPLDKLPPCLGYVLENPNPLLLKPAPVRMMVAILLSLGWHPRHIAGLLRSKYERDFGWMQEWYTYDASTRADFLCRVFAGMIHTGNDTLDHLNCDYIRHAGVCCCSGEKCDLTFFAEKLKQL